MITAYHRPKSLKEALDFLEQPDTLPLGGGTLLSRPGLAPIKVVDLQALGLNTLTPKGNSLEIGATVTLQQLLESSDVPDALKISIKLEAPLNIRNAATIAGTLVAADGRSTFATVMLALDAKLTAQPDDEEIEIGSFLPLRDDTLRGKLITNITIPLNVNLALESVARTPADKPIVCAALAAWPSGRTRLALGGYGKTPLLAMDGTEAEGLEAAARNTFHEATDEWGSAEYRMDVAATLARRCVDNIS
ncbi:MAG: FAD binding domain-containing protein [Anaerolineales bacterium]|nr:FAD binding domain-containing protein [Anaerolineales bacterium]